MNHVAINPSHQRATERLYKADRKMCAMIDANALKLDSLAADSDRYYTLSDRFSYQESDKHYELVERYIEEPELPKRELVAFSKSYFAFHGYTPYLVC